MVPSLCNIGGLPSFNVTLCLAVLFFSCFHVYRKSTSRVNRFLSSLPGPINLPLIGCTLSFLCRTPMYSNWMTILDKYSRWKMYRLPIFLDNFAVSSDPEIIQAILRSSHCYDKDKLIYDLFGLPDILATANGSKWRNERKAVGPSFHQKFLSTFDGVYQSRTKQLIVNLRKYVESGQPFNLGIEMTQLFIYVMSDTFLGVSADVPLKKHKKFAAALLEVPDFFMERFLVPPFRYDAIWKLFGRMQKFDAIKAGIYSVAQEIITVRKNYREKLQIKEEFQGDDSRRKRQIFLDTLLDNIENRHDGNECELTFETGEIFTAGGITMGTIASWVLLLSGIFPEVGKKLQHEIDTMIEFNNGSVIPEECNNLEYLDMVLKETLRHFGVPFIVRRTKEDVSINAFKTIPANTRVVIMLASLHHHPKYWEKPYEFCPEHFSPESIAKRPKNTFLPFSLGMRDCPGGKYAMQTIKCVLVQILSQMEFKAVGIKPWTNVYSGNSLKFGFTQVPTGGFMATVKFKDERIRG